MGLGPGGWDEGTEEESGLSLGHQSPAGLCTSVLGMKSCSLMPAPPPLGLNLGFKRTAAVWGPPV